MSNNFSSIQEILGPADYSLEGKVALYVGDCIELLEKLPDEVVSLTLTSPPYNIGKEYEEVVTHSKYLKWSDRWISQVYRATKSSGALWLNLGYWEVEGKARALPIAYMMWDRIPFYIHQEIVWHYEAGVTAKRFFAPRNEKWLWCLKNSEDYTFNLDEVRDPNVKYPKQKKHGKLRCHPLGKNPGDVWKIPKVTSGKNRSPIERTSHPAQFPIAVIERIIKAASNPRELVLDPFMGSGSTAEAALMLERPVIGFEIKPEYLEISVKRIERALATGRQAQLGL